MRVINQADRKETRWTVYHWSFNWQQKKINIRAHRTWIIRTMQKKYKKWGVSANQRDWSIGLKRHLL